MCVSTLPYHYYYVVQFTMFILTENLDKDHHLVTIIKKNSYVSLCVTVANITALTFNNTLSHRVEVSFLPGPSIPISMLNVKYLINLVKPWVVQQGILRS